jgi:hypothetical protein
VICSLSIESVARSGQGETASNAPPFGTEIASKRELFWPAELLAWTEAGLDRADVKIG